MDNLSRCLFWRMVRERLGTPSPRAELARLAGTSPEYVSRLVAGEGRRGKRWVRLGKLLTAEELERLGGRMSREEKMKFLTPNDKVRNSHPKKA